VTSCPRSTRPSARIETTHSMPPYRVGGTANHAGASIAILIGADRTDGGGGGRRPDWWSSPGADGDDELLGRVRVREPHDLDVDEPSGLAGGHHVGLGEIAPALAADR